MCWLTEGPTSKWPIICLDEACSEKCDSFNLGLPEFIHGWLSAEIAVPVLTPPDFFPLPDPVFVQLPD